VARLDVLTWHLSLTPARLDNPYVRAGSPQRRWPVWTRQLLLYNVFGASSDEGLSTSLVEM